MDFEFPDALHAVLADLVAEARKDAKAEDALHSMVLAAAGR